MWQRSCNAGCGLKHNCLDSAQGIPFACFARRLQCASTSVRPRLFIFLKPLQGVAEGDIFSVSAATSAGVQPLVRAVRSALDALPAAPSLVEQQALDGQEATPALNIQVCPVVRSLAVLSPRLCGAAGCGD